MLSKKIMIKPVRNITPAIPMVPSASNPVCGPNSHIKNCSIMVVVMKKYSFYRVYQYWETFY